MYVEELISDGVINTMPMATLEAVADHGATPRDPEAWDTIRGTYDAARSALKSIEESGVSMAEVAQQLENEGVAKFVEAWEELLAHVGAAMAAV